MAFRKDILEPIPGENPAGSYLRRDPVYAEIEEAAREEPDFPHNPKDVWQTERKVADWSRVSALCQEALALRSKDLTLASWLAEASVRLEGFAGLESGLSLILSLSSDFWEHLYPPLDGADVTLRARPIGQIARRSPLWVKQVPLTHSGLDFFKYRESRDVGYEAAAGSVKQREDREKKITEGKLSPEGFDKSVEDTPKSFYVETEKRLKALASLIEPLKKVFLEKFGTDAPSWAPLADAVKEVQRVSAALLAEKRKADPDPEPVAGAELGEAEVGTPVSLATQLYSLSAFTGTEPPQRREWILQLAELAAQMRQLDPASAGPYLMLRGLRFGELRAAAQSGDLRSLEAPPTEIRRQLKIFAIDGKWKELLDLAESAMALPCSRAWLDLQRVTVEACTHLGDQYNGIAIAIRSAVKSLITDLPEVRRATLMDDTPTANAETQAWLDGLLAEPTNSAPDPAEPATLSPVQPAWKKRLIDTSRLATDVVRKGDKTKGAEMMQSEIEAQRSGRGRFQRRLELVELLCGPAASPEVAQPLIDDLSRMLETHKLEDWEDRELIVRTLTVIYRNSAKLKDDDTERKTMFERICRLDPAQAISLK
jgi:type VI secretion system protein ImpA